MKVELSMTDNLSNEFTNLTAEEKKIALKILQEYAENGKSSTYNQVILSDYEEIPVSIRACTLFIFNKAKSFRK